MKKDVETTLSTCRPDAVFSLELSKQPGIKQDFSCRPASSVYKSSVVSPSDFIVCKIENGDIMFGFTFVDGKVENISNGVLFTEKEVGVAITLILENVKQKMETALQKTETEIEWLESRIKDSFISLTLSLKAKDKSATRLYISTQEMDLNPGPDNRVDEVIIFTTENEISVEGRTPLGAIKIGNVSNPPSVVINVFGTERLQSLQFLDKLLTILNYNLEHCLMKFENKSVGVWGL